MNNIFRILKADLKALSKHFFAIVVAVALTILPSLYAWLNIYSNWDPYGNTGNIKIAVVSLDKGYSLADGTTINKGLDVIKDLSTSTSMHWVVVDTEEEAVSGTYAGTYYAAVVIDSEFTYNMYNMITAWTNQPTITYYENHKKNAVATKITDTAVASLKHIINENYIEVLISSLLQQAGSISKDMPSSNPMDSLMRILTETTSLLKSCNRTINIFMSAGDSLDNATTSINRTVGLNREDLSKIIHKLNDNNGTDVPIKTVAQLDIEINKVNEQIDEALKNLNAGSTDETQLPQIIASITSAANAAGKMGDMLLQWSDSIEPDTPDTELKLFSAIKASGDSIQSSTLSGSTNSQYAQQELQNLDKALADIEDATSRIPNKLAVLEAKAIAQVLSSYFYRLENQLNYISSAVSSNEYITDAVKECHSLVYTLECLTGSLLIPTADDLYKDLKASLSDTTDTLNAIKVTSDDAEKLISAFEDTSIPLRQSLERVQSVISSTDSSIDDLMQLLEKQGYDEQLQTIIAMLSSNPQLYGQYFSKVVATSITKVYPIDNYGSAMAPFYSVLAIWVGGVMLVAIIKVHARRDGLISPTPAQLFFGRYALFFILSQLQAATIITGDLFLLRIQCLHPVLLYISGIITSLVFSLLIYALTISFGDLGKAIVVVIMVLQISGSSGTFPIELLPEMYQRIYLFFPFPYAINAMRECICGLYRMFYIEMIAKLMIFGIAALIIGLLVRKPFIGLNHYVEEKLHETKML